MTNEKIEATERFLRSKFRKESKESILNAMFTCLSYTVIESVANRCEFDRLMREQKKEDEKRNELRNYIDEYNSLCQKAKKIGFINMTNEDIDRIIFLQKKLF